MKEEEEGARRLAKKKNHHRGARAPPPVPVTSERRPRISVLHVDDDVIVIRKPCNLRSVPGHANPPPPSPEEEEEAGSSKSMSSSSAISGSPPAGSSSSPTSKKRVRLGDVNGDASEGSSSASISEGNNGSSPPHNSHRRTAQEAWRAAIVSVAASSSAESSSSSPSDERDDDHANAVRLIRALSELPNVSSVPRRLAPFVRFCTRNRSRLLPVNSDEKIASDDGNKVCARHSGEEDPLRRHRRDEGGGFEKIARDAFRRIKSAQEPLLSLPETTRDDESALGQLRLMGYEKCRHTDPIRVVHRLDCETSGVMVFARTESAAQKLSEAWRRRGGVKKVYLAKVRTWPPYHENGLTDGVIDLPLRKSEERLKWEVCDPDDVGAKSSKTLWSVHDITGGDVADAADEDGSVDAAGGKNGSSASSGRPSGSADVETRSSKGSAGVTLSLRPVTGRTHQLRVHCAAINGGGIVGDSLYGTDRVRWRGRRDGSFEGDDDADDGFLRLHAYELSFPHPTKDEIVTYTCPKAW